MIETLLEFVCHFVAVKPEIERFIASAEALRVFWHRLPSEVDNGKIFGYKICCKSSSSLTPCENAVYVSERATSATVRDLIPFTDYTVEISAGTVAGYGPPSLLEAKTGEASRCYFYLFFSYALAIIPVLYNLSVEV